MPRAKRSHRSQPSQYGLQISSAVFAMGHECFACLSRASLGCLDTEKYVYFEGASDPAAM